MIEYSQKDIEQGKILKNRFTLLKLREHCASMSAKEFSININNWIQWRSLNKELDNLLDYYDNGGKINEDLLIKLNDKKLENNLITVKRLVKLIRIV